MARQAPEFEEVRRRIARHRRRMDRSAQRLVDHSTRWLGWRTYVSRFPARSLAAAVGVGFVVAAASSAVKWPQQFGVRLYEYALQGAWQRLWVLLRQVTVRESPVEAEDAVDASGDE